MVSLKGLPDALRGVAWPTSARAVRRPVKSGNERDPCHMLLTCSPEQVHSYGIACDKCDESAGYVRSVWPESSGLHAGGNGTDNEMLLRKETQIP